MGSRVDGRARSCNNRQHLTQKHSVKRMSFLPHVSTALRSEQKAAQERIQSKMSISVFLNPTDEIVDDEDEEILQQVADSYTEGDRAYETDEEKPVEIPRIRQQKAIEAIQLLERYEEQQEDGDRDVLRKLAELEVIVEDRIHLTDFEKRRLLATLRRIQEQRARCRFDLHPGLGSDIGAKSIGYK